MEGPQRGRSSSAGHHSNHHMNHSPSPHQFQDHSSRLDLESSLGPVAFTSGAFSTDLTASSHPNNLHYNYLDESSRLQHFDPQPLPGDHFNGQDLETSFQSNGIATELQHSPSNLDIQNSSGHQFSSDLLPSDTSSGFGDFTQHHQDLTEKQRQSFDGGFLIDSDLPGGMQPQHQSINPADIMSSNMSSPQNLIPTPPNLIPPESTSPRGGSPAPHQGQIYSPNHSRHASLDPSSAIFPHGQQPADWSNMLQQQQFQTHRRAQSEHSDVSSSVAPSPFLAQEGFDAFDQNPSPMLAAQQDQLYQDALAIEQFSLSDPQQHPRMSPGHSPFVSPRMSPQTGLGLAHGLPQESSFLLSQDMQNFSGGSRSEIYAGQPEDFSQFGARHGSGDLGQATQMAPPEINVEYAPNTRQSSFEPSRPETDHDALSPPESGRRGRLRAKSDPNLSRPVTPGVNGPTDTTIRQRSLSPFDTSFSPSQSRDVSPASKSSRRSSTSSIPNRDYILELADPSRPAASGTDKRVQKHPATFQCTLCPKRFTRAYNLRSHLRTHTDERPFVCTVCGKAFARQHDRKRHEGLHSGEKKFVCKGELGAGGSWGCGRRFARADALGRHFRSEAGRICIKPLLDEEAMERQRVYDEQMMGQSQNMHVAAQIPAPTPLNINGGTGSGFTLPAALLLQYPALQGLQWDQLGAPGQGDEGELSGRSSFDASSQGEYFDDEDGGYASGAGGGGGSRWGLAGGAGDWASDYEGR